MDQPVITILFLVFYGAISKEAFGVVKIRTRYTTKVKRFAIVFFATILAPFYLAYVEATTKKVK